MNQDSVIVKGVPNEDIFNLSYRINEISREFDLQTRVCWGAHMTAARFCEVREAPYAVNLLNFISGFEFLGKVPVFAVDVGYFQVSNHAFDLFTQNRFQLS